MTDDPRVEAAARALAELDYGVSLEGMPKGYWHHYQARACAALAAADKAAWKPISEYDPAKHGEVVDLWAGGRRWTNMEWSATSPVNPGGAWKREGDDWWQELGTLNPSHFMPLPAPPEDGGKQ